MGNAKNKKVPKKRKLSSKSMSRNLSDQKENVPKIPKNRVSKTDDGIAMSKQLLVKKSNVQRSNKRSSSQIERVCPNGKPIPSLSELEKMFEDSDDDNQSPNTPTKKICETSTPKQTLENISETKLLSPTTISKISDRMLDLLSNIDPIELLQDVPPPPVIPQKKRKKPDEPYIVGCKDRPQVIKKPNTNFCKGDCDYGVQASADPEEPPSKRAKKSKIPKYSKSIFNAHSDEIAERLNKDDAGSLSDASSDSNKTIEYDPTLFQRQRPHSFSPLPSTSKDNETFMKNVELFNKSLQEINIPMMTTPDKDPIKSEDEVKVIDTSHDTIVIDDVEEEEIPVKIVHKNNETDIIEIIEVDILENKKSKDNSVNCREINDDDDCLMVPNSPKNTNQADFTQTIDIDDEYGNIDLDYGSIIKESVDIIEIDDVIAENESLLDKLKNNGMEKINKINTVVDVPTTYKNSTTPQTTGTPNLNHNLNETNISDGIAQNIQNNHSSQASLNQIDVELVTNSTSTPNIESGNSIEKVVDGFFNSNVNLQRNNNNTISIDESDEDISEGRSMFFSICEAIIQKLQNTAATTINNLTARRARPSVNKARRPVPADRNLRNTANRRISDGAVYNSSQSSDIFDKQSTHEPAVPASSRSVPAYYSNFRNTANRTISNPTVINLSQSSVPEKQPTQEPAVPAASTPEPTRNIGDCPICMDPLSNVGIASTICGHVFCLKCIQAAIKTNGKRCPTCRKILKGAGGGYHQLYL